MACRHAVQLHCGGGLRTPASGRVLAGFRPYSSASAAAAMHNKLMVKTYNAISPKGLERYPSDQYKVGPDIETEHAIMLRSHQLQDEEVGDSVRCIARCGAGVNNIPVARMTERGIPVFNSPGANANAVRELVLCALMLASRGIVQGVKHVDTMFVEESEAAVIKKRVEKDKSKFGGQELRGKTLGVIGLGHIGASVAESALGLGMSVIAYDPALSLEAAWRLPGQLIDRTLRIEELLNQSDYITLHVPYMQQTHHMLDLPALQCLKPNCHLINFSRGELIDTVALKTMYETGGYHGAYIADFPDMGLKNNDKCVFMPHLGASTEEAEENSASMAADEIRDFLEHGIIRNSVNFPETVLPRRGTAVRLCIVNKNMPGVLGELTTLIGKQGLNILQTVNTSRDDIAYNVVDLDGAPSDPSALADEIGRVGGVLSTRFLMGEPGLHFKVINQS